MIRGSILAYSIDAAAGVIKGVDGKAYFFADAQWSSPAIKPANDMSVTFIRRMGRALNVKRVGLL